MKKKRYFAWILFSVCLVMLVAAVFPHHHHDDLTLCMHYDLQTCCDAECPDSPHHHGGRDCGNACVTSFCCDAPHPSHLISPLFYFIVDLGIRADAYRLSLSERVVDGDTCAYVERLHPLDVQAVGGWRAPPCV
ncbi:DUF6769 family protein [Bacteroides sp. Marseille-P3684]|uniref:DUF6769 family protein n=1 Tax=Bacteroides sp. Marseille-P3684 TaxID=2086579 RepID=UPI0013007BF0|nr:DUF6769 family protein [Bacteroides sp. Marseille-P3684]